MDITNYAPSACNFRPLEFTAVNILSTGLEEKFRPMYEKTYNEQYHPANHEGIFRSAPTMIVVHSKKHDRRYPDVEDGTIAGTLMEF